MSGVGQLAPRTRRSDSTSIGFPKLPSSMLKLYIRRTCYWYKHMVCVRALRIMADKVWVMTRVPPVRWHKGPLSKLDDGGSMEAVVHLIRVHMHHQEDLGQGQVERSRESGIQCKQEAVADSCVPSGLWELPQTPSLPDPRPKRTPFGP